MTGIVEFLEARIAADEAVARAAKARHGSEWLAGDGKVRGTVVYTGHVGHYELWDWNDGPHSANTSDQAAAHIARHDPARVLAECKAKRRVIARYLYWDKGGPDAGVAIQDLGYSPSWREVEELERVLWILAVPYADHPDFDPQWAL